MMSQLIANFQTAMMELIEYSAELSADQVLKIQREAVGQGLKDALAQQDKEAANFFANLIKNDR